MGVETERALGQIMGGGPMPPQPITIPHLNHDQQLKQKEADSSN